jgi:hypothetical protein
MLKLKNFLYQKLDSGSSSIVQGGVGDPTKGYPGGGYDADCVLDTDCGDGTTGADVARGVCDC